jgi:hypothetical protein
MIRITMELVSARGHDHDRLLGVGVISNIGGDEQHGDYSVWLSKMEPREREAWKQGKIVLTPEDIQHFFDTDVTHFDRERRGCWDLLYIALRQLVASRNPAVVAVVPPRERRSRRPLRRVERS